MATAKYSRQACTAAVIDRVDTYILSHCAVNGSDNGAAQLATSKRSDSTVTAAYLKCMDRYDECLQHLNDTMPLEFREDGKKMHRTAMDMLASEIPAIVAAAAATTTATTTATTAAAAATAASQRPRRRVFASKAEAAEHALRVVRERVSYTDSLIASRQFA